jgi:hypothetical protein
VEGIEFRTLMRARRGMAKIALLDRMHGGPFGDDVPQVPILWGEHGQPAIPLARRDSESDAGRDVVAERERIRTAVHLAHQRSARKRRSLTRLA